LIGSDVLWLSGNEDVDRLGEVVLHKLEEVVLANPILSYHRVYQVSEAAEERVIHRDLLKLGGLQLQLVDEPIASIRHLSVEHFSQKFNDGLVGHLIVLIQIIDKDLGLLHDPIAVLL
jgi:hypothetical protein